MPGTYHIIHANARYATRRVRCYETGRYHRHKTHEEESVSSVCGRTLVSRRDQFCNIGIADPNWKYDCGFTPLAGDTRTMKTDKKGALRLQTHLLLDRPAIDWPCRT